MSDQYELGEPFPNVHLFSDGYYLVDGLYVVPDETVTSPTLNEHLYDYLTDHTGDESTPVLLRHSEAKYHFRVLQSDSVPSASMIVPFDIASKMSVDTMPTVEQFLLAKPGHAQTIVDMSNCTVGGC